MTTIDALIVIHSLSRQIEVNLKTITDWQNKLYEWEELAEEDKPRFTTPDMPMEQGDLMDMLETITEETTRLFAALTSHSKALFESIPDKELTIYIIE